MKVSNSPKICTACGQKIPNKDNESEKKPDETKDTNVKSKSFFDPLANFRKNCKTLKTAMKEPEDFNIFAAPKYKEMNLSKKNEEYTKESEKTEVKSKSFFESLNPITNLRITIDNINKAMQIPTDPNAFAAPAPMPYQSKKISLSGSDAEKVF